MIVISQALMIISANSADCKTHHDKVHMVMTHSHWTTESRSSAIAEENKSDRAICIPYTHQSTKFQIHTKNYVDIAAIL